MKLQIVVCATLLAAPAAAQPAQSTQTLTMQQAVEIALRQQPSLRQSRAQLEAARGRVDQVESNLRPSLSVSASASVGGGGPVRDFLDPSTNAAVGASANWRIWDFGQNAAQLRAAEASARASAAGVDTRVLDVRQDVELSYLEAVARGRLVGVAQTTVKSEELHVDQAKRFVAAQAKDPIEVVQAQARLANAKAALAQAQSNAATALANLRAAIGWVDPSRALAITDGWPATPEMPPDLTALVDTARKQRPELAQADLTVAAADASIDAARAQRRPVLSANARTEWAPSSGETWPQPSWSAGLSLTWLLYDGGRISADVRVAKANRESALASRDALLIDLTSQLDADRAQIEANQSGVVASNEAVEAARAQLKLAEARYAAGVGSQIELTDAQTAVTTAEGNLVQAEWQLAAAWASLRRDLGVQ